MNKDVVCFSKSHKSEQSWNSNSDLSDTRSLAFYHYILFPPDILNLEKRLQNYNYETLSHRGKAQEWKINFAPRKERLRDLTIRNIMNLYAEG